MKSVEKKKLVKDLVDKISTSTIVMVTTYRGLKAEEMTLLRKKVRGKKSEYLVVKNTLAKKAFTELKLEKINEYLKGPVGFAFGFDDPIILAKELKDFTGEHENFVLKIGMLSNEILQKERLLELASLPSKNVLIQKLAIGIKAPLYNLNFVLNALLQKLPLALLAVKKQKGEE